MKNDSEDRKITPDDTALPRRLIAALQEDEAWFRTMADEAPMGISISRDGINLYANQACLRMFGYESSQEFIGTSQLNRVAPDYRWQMNLNINKRKRGEAVPNQYEFMGLRKDGSTVPRLYRRVKSSTWVRRCSVGCLFHRLHGAQADRGRAQLQREALPHARRNGR